MSTDFSDIFDRYFENSLSETERRDFDLRLADDIEFSEAFAEYSVVYKAAKLAGGEAIRKPVDSITSHPEDSGPGAQVIKFRTVRMLYAAAVVIVLVSTGVWAFIAQSSTPQSLHADHFEVYPGLSSTSGDSDLSEVLCISAKINIWRLRPLRSAVYISKNQHLEVSNHWFYCFFLRKNNVLEIWRLKHTGFICFS